MGTVTKKLRHLGGGWALRPRLQRLVPGLGGQGGAETAWKSRNFLTGQRLPGRLENKTVAEGGSNTLGAGKWKAASEGTWEKSLVCARAGEGRKEGVGPHRIPPTPQQAYRPTSYQKVVLRSTSPPPPCHPLRTCRTWGCLPSRRAGLNNCLKPTTAGAVPAQACLPFGGATLPQSSTKHQEKVPALPSW